MQDNKVQFLVIGGWALPAYGYQRFTKDVDIFIKPTKQNVARTIKALRSLGYIVDEEQEKLFFTKKVLFRQYILQTDIHPTVKGVTFSKVWKGRKETTIKGVKVFVPSVEDLIKMKQSAGRPQDMIDVGLLTEFLKQEKKENGMK